MRYAIIAKGISPALMEMEIKKAGAQNITRAPSPGTGFLRTG